MAIYAKVPQRHFTEDLQHESLLLSWLKASTGMCIQAEKSGAHEGAELPLARLLTGFHNLCNVLPEASRQVTQAPCFNTYVLNSQTHSFCKAQCKYLAVAKSCTASLLRSCPSYKCCSPSISQHQRGIDMGRHCVMA